jgi:citrate lyase beta subunit/acyl dehydratase
MTETQRMPQPTVEGTAVQAKRTHPRVQHVFPADNWYFWLKAAEDRPDEIITDLEDAVATPRKELARDIFIAVLKLFRGEPPAETEMAAVRQANSPEGRGPHLPVFLAKMKAVKGLTLTAAEQETLREAEASPDRKIQALLAQVARCHSLDGIIVTLRINNLHTKWSAGDLWHVVRAMGNRVDRILLPKVEGPEDIILLHRILSAIEEEQGWERNGLKIEALVELPSAVRQLEAVCRCTPRMVCSIFGIVDWTAATGGRDQDHQQTYALYGRLRTVEASVAAGLEAIDGITPSLQRHRSFVDAGKAARLGFTGKWSVNPNNLAGVLDFMEGRRPNRRDPRAKPVSIPPGIFAEAPPRTGTSPEYPPFPLEDLERFARERRPLLPPRVLELRDATVRRSVVPVSAAQPAELGAALASNADEVVVDLAPLAGNEVRSIRTRLLDTLRAARAEQTLLTLQADPADQECWRIFEELAGVLGSRLGACALPDAMSPTAVRLLDARLTDVETRLGLPLGHIRIEGRIRTEPALDQAYEIATASRRVAALIFDIPVADLFRQGRLAVAAKTRSIRKAEYLLKGQLIVATSEAGIDAVDGLTAAGNRVSREALDAANHGFSGKLARLDEVEEINGRLLPPRSFIQELTPVIQGVTPESIRDALSPDAIRAILRTRLPVEWVEPFVRTCRQLAEPYWNGARKIEEFPAVLRAELQRRWYPASIERALQPFELFAVADQDRGLGAVAYSDPWRANAIELVDAATARVYEHIIRTAWKAGLLTQEEDRRYHQAFERLRTALLLKEAAGLVPGMRLPGYATTVEDWMVKLFALASGDRNLYHLDDEFVVREYARGVIKFDGRIAHGLLTLLVSLVGLTPVAAGFRIRSLEEVRYKAPVRIGDAVTPVFSVVDVQDSRIRLRVEALRQDGQVAMEGAVLVSPPGGAHPSGDGASPPDPARLRAARERSATVTAFPRDKQAPVFAQGKTVSQDFQAQIPPEVSDGYWALVGSADPSLWNLAVCLGMIAHTSANFASPGWILLSTKLGEQQEPIREGDTLTAKATLEITRLTREKRPIARIVMEVRNQHDRPVFRGEVTKLGDPGLVRITA